MNPFTVLAGRAAMLEGANVDTDQIIPARFLRKPRSAGYQNFLFHDLRRDQPDFPLTEAVLAACPIVLAGPNFGCGSSREGAVYALVDAGVRCVIAPGFGDIFAGNAAKNGLLTIALPEADIMRLREANGPLTVDLPGQRVVMPNGSAIGFEIDAFRKKCLLEGLDDIGLTAAFGAEISAWEEADRALRSWARPG
jgi:3-isopropylmalate/(R)-2-methylmalate dehydratase small subunit